MITGGAYVSLALDGESGCDSIGINDAGLYGVQRKGRGACLEHLDIGSLHENGCSQSREDDESGVHLLEID